MSRRRSKVETTDWILVVAVAALLIFGLMALYSATLSTYIADSFFTRQLGWLSLGLLAALVAYLVPYTVWHKLATPLMGFSLLLLAVTLFFARTGLGAPTVDDGLGAQPRHLGTMLGLGNSVQPGVFARLVAVIYIAAWLASKGEELNKVTYGLMPFGVILGLVAGFVVLQPDLSTAVLIVVTGVAMFYFAGGDPIQIFVSGLIMSGTFVFLALNLPYARRRLEDYVVALSDPSKMPYHVQRATEAISQGGILGVGFGAGRMKFGYLPVPHTDSIFAVVAEELGLIGCLFLIGLFALLAFRGYRVTLATPDPFGSLVAFGVTTMILSEAILNIFVMLGIVPPTGTALPFFSYGGTQMLITLGGMGLVVGISRGRPKGDWNEILDRWWGDWRARVPSPRRRSSFARNRS
jgi:cell division protein FtsW